MITVVLAIAGPACASELEGGGTERGESGGDPGGGGGSSGSGGAGGGGTGTPTTPDGKPRVADGCVITGCNDQLCSDRLVSTDCTPTAQDECFQNAICERGDTGSCRWTPTDELNVCLARAAGMPAPDGGAGSGDRGSGSGFASDGGVPRNGGGSSGGSSGSGACRQTGCFGEVCSNRDVSGGSCSWSNEYACYFAADCEAQADGSCGWTHDETLDSCLEIAGGGGFGGFGF